MNKNLNQKIILIVAVLLIFVYGIFGIPTGFSGQAILASLTKRIHLGLDLQGGAHLILEVKVVEALNAETDNTVQAVQADLKAANLAFGLVNKPNPATPQTVQVTGVTPAQSSAVRTVLDDKFANQYDISGGGGDSTFTLTMKPSEITALNTKTLQQAIEAIRDRVDTLGVSEPVIQEYGLGANQILVELPGVSNMDQVKVLISDTARLEIHAVVGGPYADEQAATAAQGGAIPPDVMLAHGSGSMVTGNDADSIYALQRVSVVAGNEFRSADPGVDPQTNQRIVDFTLTNAAGDKFYDYTSKNVGQSMAVVMGGRVREVARIDSGIRDRGYIRGSFSPDEVLVLSKLLSGPARYLLRSSTSRTARWAHRWAPTRCARASPRLWWACWW